MTSCYDTKIMDISMVCLPDKRRTGGDAGQRAGVLLPLESCGLCVNYETSGVMNIQEQELF